MVEIEKKLYQEIKDYCKLNDLVIKDFINKILKKAFTVEKYGDKPFTVQSNIVEEIPVVITPEVINNVIDTCFPKTEITPISINKTEQKPIGKMVLPNEKPYNDITIVQTDYKPIMEEDVKIVKKSKKRKLN